MIHETHNKRSKKQRQIVKTAKALFLNHGIRRVTVEEICRKGNVSKMTFYKYFANKQELAEHIVREMIQEGWERLDEVEAMPIPFTEKLQHLLTYKLAVTAQMCNDFIEEWLQMPFLEEERKRWLQRVMQFITDAQKRGDVRAEIRPEFILIMAENMQKVVEDKRLSSLYADYTELTKEIWNFFYYGIVRGK